MFLFIVFIILFFCFKFFVEVTDAGWLTPAFYNSLVN